MFIYIINLGLEDAKNIMPSSGTRIKEGNLNHVDDNSEKFKTNNNVSRRNSKLMDLNKVSSKISNSTRDKLNNNRKLILSCTYFLNFS